MSPRYKQYVNKMLDDNRNAFDSFKIIHDKYSSNPDEFQDDFNHEGEKILEIIHDYETKLCANQERGMYNVYSGKLAEKFNSEIKKTYPMVDHIGLKVEKFEIKKINIPKV